MDSQQFTLIVGKFDDIKDDISTIREEQVKQGKALIKVCTKVGIHSKFNRAIGASAIGLFFIWLRSKLI